MKYRVLIFLSLFAFTVAFANGQPFEDLFPDSRTVYVSESEQKDFRLALGPLQKNNGVWQAQREEKINGTLFRRTIEVNDSYSRQETVNAITGYFSSLEGRLLYACGGLDCGSSAAWANENFGIKQLYGLDRYQHYWVWELSGNSDHRIAIVYAVQRGNKRVYAQLDLLDVEKGSERSIASSPEAILAELETRRFFTFPGLSFSGSSPRYDEAHVKSIVAALDRNPRLQLYIVGHDYQGNSLEEQLSRSKSYADQLQQLIEKAGIKSGRLQSQGVGSLAPRGKYTSGRLELVTVNSSR